MRRRGVAPRVGKRTKLRAGFGDHIDRVQQIETRPRQSIEQRHDDDVAEIQGIQQAGEPRSIRPGAGHLLGIDLGTAGAPQRVLLQRQTGVRSGERLMSSLDIRAPHPADIEGVVCVKFSKSGMGGGLAELRAKATSLCSIENNHPFVPTCLLAERRAQRQSRMPW